MVSMHDVHMNPAVAASSHPVERTTTGLAALSGAVAAATALGLSELLAGLLPGAASLVAAVGQVVIDLQPPGAKDVVVALFGTNDKLALEVFVALVAVAVGAGLGIVARRSFVAAAAGFAAFGVVGFLAALGDPNWPTRRWSRRPRPSAWVRASRSCRGRWPASTGWPPARRATHRRPARPPLRRRAARSSSGSAPSVSPPRWPG